MQSLTARTAARTALQGVPELAGKIFYPDQARPADATLYARLTVISNPPVNDFQGEAYAVVRAQVDVYSLSTTDSQALSTAEKARVALTAAGFRRVGGGQPITHEGQRDPQGRLWYRVTTDYSIEA